MRNPKPNDVERLADWAFSDEAETPEGMDRAGALQWRRMALAFALSYESAPGHAVARAIGVFRPTKPTLLARLLPSLSGGVRRTETDDRVLDFEVPEGTARVRYLAEGGRWRVLAEVPGARQIHHDGGSADGDEGRFEFVAEGEDATGFTATSAEGDVVFPPLGEVEP
ncbi:MAG: hypothetical protein AMXMBFR81_02940 [Chthonomonas sp.]